MKVLITAGGTEEPVDAVRRLTNLSTGRTGGVIAGLFADRGAEVLLLQADRAPAPASAVACETFVTFNDLETALRRRLEGEAWDAVIHAAAVGDFSVEAVEVAGHEVPIVGKGKIGSGHEVVVRLRPNPKIIDNLKRWSCSRDLEVVGFKLTDDPDPDRRREQVRSLFDRNAVDLVVHNDLSGIGRDRHSATIYDTNGPLARTETKEQLAHELYRLLSKGDA